MTALWDMRCPRYLSVLHCDSRTACSRFSGDAYCSKSLLPFFGATMNRKVSPAH